MKAKKKTRPDWKRPKEILLRAERKHFHARLPPDLLAWLDLEAHDAGLDRTTLVEAVLSDYQVWMEAQRPKRRAAVS